MLLSTDRALSASIAFERCDQLCNLVFSSHVVSHDAFIRSGSSNRERRPRKCAIQRGRDQDSSAFSLPQRWSSRSHARGEPLNADRSIWLFVAPTDDVAYIQQSS